MKQIKIELRIDVPESELDGFVVVNPDGSVLNFRATDEPVFSVYELQTPNGSELVGEYEGAWQPDLIGELIVEPALPILDFEHLAFRVSPNSDFDLYGSIYALLSENYCII